MDKDNAIALTLEDQVQDVAFNRDVIRRRYELSVGYVRTCSVNGVGEDCDEGGVSVPRDGFKCVSGLDVDAWPVLTLCLRGGGFGAKFCGRGSGFGVRGRELVPGLCTVNHGPHQRYAFTGYIPRSRDRRHARADDHRDTPEDSLWSGTSANSYRTTPFSTEATRDVAGDIRLISSYLEDRNFQVSIEGSLSERARVKTGVPQRKRLLPPENFTLFQEEIPFKNETKYLGITIDRKITGQSTLKKPRKKRRQYSHNSTHSSKGNNSDNKVDTLQVCDSAHHPLRLCRMGLRSEDTRHQATNNAEQNSQTYNGSGCKNKD
uniref:Uncharacterized protein n=1 Tax=Timema genevievae TaxID=629358 RepID=A0A7R9PP00_TIMGE|nr:unnamed protein product [Timema genevievae]